MISYEQTLGSSRGIEKKKKTWLRAGSKRAAICLHHLGWAQSRKQSRKTKRWWIVLFVSRLGKFKPFLFYHLIVLIKSEINQVFRVLLLPIRPKKLQFFGKAGGGRRDEEEPRPWRLRSICHTQTLSLSHTHTSFKVSQGAAYRLSNFLSSSSEWRAAWAAIRGEQ